MTMRFYTHEGYTLIAYETDSPVVYVFDPRCSNQIDGDAPIYVTTSLARAKQWIEAYKDGQAWATDAVIHQAIAWVRGSVKRRG